MKIVVFGATGAVGKQVAIQALGLDYKVTAFVRGDKSRLEELNHRNLHIFQAMCLIPLPSNKL